MIGGKGESAIEVIDLVMRCQPDASRSPVQPKSCSYASISGLLEVSAHL
jgi:hypothetical protein